MSILSRKFTKREKILLCILAVVILAGAYLLWVQMPVSEGISEAENEISSLETEISINQTMLTKMQSMQAGVDAVFEKTEEPPVVPVYNNTQALTAYLGGKLSSLPDYSYNTASVSLPSGEDGSGIVRRTISLSFVCSSYHQAVKLIEELENGPYMCQITDLTVTPVADKDKSSDILLLSGNSVQVDLSIVYFERIG